MESKLQYEIVLFLQDQGYFFYSVPNEAKRSPQLAARLKAMGMRSGVADLVVLLPGGRSVFLEVKTATGKQATMQKLFEQRVTELGFVYQIVRSVQDVQSVLDDIAKKQ